MNQQSINRTTWYYLLLCYYLWNQQRNKTDRVQHEKSEYSVYTIKVIQSNAKQSDIRVPNAMIDSVSLSLLSLSLSPFSLFATVLADRYSFRYDLHCSSSSLKRKTLWIEVKVIVYEKRSFRVLEWRNEGGTSHGTSPVCCSS